MSTAARDCRVHTTLTYTHVHTQVNKIREIPQHLDLVVTHTDSPEVYLWNMDKQPGRSRDKVSTAEFELSNGQRQLPWCRTRDMFECVRRERRLKGGGGHPQSWGGKGRGGDQLSHLRACSKSASFPSPTCHTVDWQGRHRPQCARPKADRPRGRGAVPAGHLRRGALRGQWRQRQDGGCRGRGSKRQR